MEIGLGILTFGTLGFVLAFAYINKRVTEKQLEETRAERRKAEAPLLARYIGNHHPRHHALHCDPRTLGYH